MKKTFTLLFSFGIIPLFFISCHKKNIEKRGGNGSVVYQTMDSAVIYVPNVFTPNGDRVNDVLRMRGRNISSLSLTIYDREEYFIQFDKNKVVYQSTDVNFQWDGIIQAGKHKGKIMDGNYPFVVDIVTTSGKSIHAESDVAVIIDPSKYCLKHLPNCASDEQFQNGEYNVANPLRETFGKCK